LRRALRSERHHDGQGVELRFWLESALLSVSPFAVTVEPDVGDSFFTFVPSVERPLESVTPDCD
jgi:hypothetical protein